MSIIRTCTPWERDGASLSRECRYIDTSVSDDEYMSLDQFDFEDEDAAIAFLASQDQP